MLQDSTVRKNYQPRMEMKPADGTSSLFMQSSHHRAHSVKWIEHVKEITFSFKAISVTSIPLKLLVLSMFMMSSFKFCVVFKSPVIQDCFCELQKGQTKPIYLSSWTNFTFWICRKVHSPGFLTRTFITCLLDRTVQQRLFRQSLVKIHYLR